MRIFLIGFMGSGKSHVGQRLAQLSGLAFIDLDQRIEQTQGRSIRQIFAQEGEEAFRQMERAALHALAKETNCIVACGGGTPCFFDNIDWMNRHGLTIYLQTPVSILAQRLQTARAQRPLIKDLEGETLAQFIEQKLREREPYYLQATVVYQIQTPKEAVAEALWQQYHNITGH